MGYICAELRKPVEDTVYRKLLSQRADDIGYVYFVGMPLPPELSMNSSVTFIKTGKSENPQVRLVTLQTENPFTPTLEGSISVTNMGQAEGIAHMVAEDNHYRGEWYRFSSSAAAQLMIRRIRETLDTYKLICKIKKSNIT